MTNPKKAKGDKGEREAAELLSDLLGFKVRRKLGAGRQDDEGDLDGLPHSVVQVCDWKDPARAIREKPAECARQQENAAAIFGFTMIRLRGGVWRCVLTPQQMATYIRESLAEHDAA